MANTFTLIASATVGSGGSNLIDFTDIPSTYTDLLIKYSGRSTLAQVHPSLNIKINNSSSLIYTSIDLNNDEGTPKSISYTNNNYFNILSGDNGAQSTSNTFSNMEFYFSNYAGSLSKTASFDTVMEINGTANQMRLIAGIWASSSAISSIQLLPASAFAEYTTAYLYGIKNG